MNKKQPKNKANSVQTLLGMQEFTENGGIMTSEGELIFMRVQPINISVLSASLVEQHMSNLTKLLNLHPNVEILCCDAQQSFEENKLYLQKRETEEDVPQIAELLRQEQQFLDDIQSNMATSREFIFVLRIAKTDEVSVIAHFAKLLDQHGFYPTRLSKDELKQLIARYFGYYTEIPLPDVDGEAYV